MPVERRVALPIDARACTVADRHAWRPSQATEQNKTNGRNVGQRREDYLAMLWCGAAAVGGATTYGHIRVRVDFVLRLHVRSHRPE